MLKGIKIRAAIALVFCLLGFFYLTPSLTADLPEVWKKYLPADKIHLGLDLQGGMHLVLEVDTDKALEGTIERLAVDLKESLMNNKVRFIYLEGTKKKDAISFEMPDSAASSSLYAMWPPYHCISRQTSGSASGRIGSA